MAPIFALDDSIYKITEKYPETIPFFVNNGFPNFADPQLRAGLGKNISLCSALTSKKINGELFIQKLRDIIGQGDIRMENGLTEAKSETGGDIRVEGVLPCPIRIPLLDTFSAWFKENQKNLPCSADYDLKPASMGVGWIKERILANTENREELLTDLFMSAGFELFFENNLVKKYKDKDVFADISGINRLNKDFDNHYIDLKDPEKHYAVIGVVPAILMVNRQALGDRPLPTTWADILKPEFEGSVSLPLEDLDMFDAILLNIQKKFGQAGIVKLRRSFLKGMHPAAMLKSYINESRETAPAIAIMPYFFARTAPPGSPFVTVWPEDGAIISPIYLVNKRASSDKTKPFVDFLFSRKIGEVFSHQGFFPSTHPEVDNGFDCGQTFMWLGWDYIKQNDIGQLISQAKTLFYEEAGGEF